MHCAVVSILKQRWLLRNPSAEHWQSAAVGKTDVGRRGRIHSNRINKQIVLVIDNSQRIRAAFVRAEHIETVASRSVGASARRTIVDATFAVNTRKVDASAVAYEPVQFVSACDAHVMTRTAVAFVDLRLTHFARVAGDTTLAHKPIHYIATCDTVKTRI